MCRYARKSIGINLSRREIDVIPALGVVIITSNSGHTLLHIASKDEVKISDVVEQLAIEFRLSLEERAQLLPSGRQTTFANRVHWGKSYLGKAGLVELTKRAHFRNIDRAARTH